MQLQPGVQNTLGADVFFAGDRPGVVSVSGGRARSNSYNINSGQSGDQLVNSPSIQPSPDSISEFRVISHNYDAAFGTNSGSVVNVVTKSGSSALHGDLFEYLRNDALNAKNYFDPKTSDFKQNEFGGSFGGPILRDKTFFFLSYEGRRGRRGITSDPVTVPTREEREGVFSSGPAFAGSLQSQAVAEALAARNGCAEAVQAHGGTPLAAGTAFADIFPGNVIPAECFDPTAIDLLRQFVPPGNQGDGLFRSAPNARTRKDQASLRLDHNLTSQQGLSFYYYDGDESEGEPFSRFQGRGANLPGFGSRTRARFQQANLAHLWTITAKANNELRLVYYRDTENPLMVPEHTDLVRNSCANVPPSYCFSDPANPRLGITPGYGPELEGVPYIGVDGGFVIGNNPAGGFHETGNIYQLSDGYSRLLGKHTLKLGGEVRNQRLHQSYLYNVSGGFLFGGGGPNDVGFSSPLPNYLLGLPDGFAQGSASVIDVRTTQTGLFSRMRGGSDQTSPLIMEFAGNGTRRKPTPGAGWFHFVPGNRAMCSRA